MQLKNPLLYRKKTFARGLMFLYAQQLNQLLRHAKEKNEIKEFPINRTNPRTYALTGC